MSASEGSTSQGITPEIFEEDSAVYTQWEERLIHTLMGKNCDLHALTDVAPPAAVAPIAHNASSATITKWSLETRAYTDATKDWVEKQGLLLYHLSLMQQEL